LKSRAISTIIERTRDPVRNLAREELLFRQVDGRSSPEVVRFWVNSECLVRGKARNPRYGWYHEKLAEELGIPVLERSTGGGVVYQDEGNLNWSFYFRTEGSFISPTKLFGRGSKYLIEALGNLGVEAVFSAPNRIDTHGRKISGMAARSTKNTALVHGTLLLRSDLDKLNRLCIPPKGSPPVANIAEWKRDISARKVIDEVLEVLRESGFRSKFSR
jgi:lipoate---protein ligase